MDCGCPARRGVLGRLGLDSLGRRRGGGVEKVVSMWNTDAGLTRVGGFRFATATGRALRGPDETEWTGDGRQG